MSLGMILLLVVTVLLLFGVGQRVLDKLRLTDRQALLFTLLIFAGALVGDIPLGERLSVNLGGAVIPLALCVYLLIKAGTGKEKARALIAAVLSGAAVFLIGRYLPNEPEQMPIDPNYLYGPAAGLIAFALGRSRRSAFIAGVLGVILADVTQAVVNWTNGIDQRLVLGGAGVLDAVVLSGLIAVLLCELVGELTERAMRGAKPEGEFVRGEKRK